MLFSDDVDCATELAFGGVDDCFCMCCCGDCGDFGVGFGGFDGLGIVVVAVPYIIEQADCLILPCLNRLNHL
jgi:hypothetical protein